MVVPEYQAAELAQRIRAAIAEELKASSAGIPFRVTSIHKQGGILTLELEPQDPRRSLDEGMEDGRLGWNDKTTGSADVISVLPEVSCLNAVMTSGQAPHAGDIVFVNPAKFLEPLLMLWDRPQVATSATAWYFRLEDNRYDPSVTPDYTRINNLRPAQQNAFRVLGWDTSYVWGPPGTGKTTTLGWLLAAYLRHRPSDRVLLLSTTNVAVDLAIVSVDKAVPSIFGTKEKPSYLRFGSRFDPKKYAGRQHLIPLRDKALLARYEQHLQSAPAPSDAEKYLCWKESLDQIRQQIRQQTREYLKTTRLAAMTATYATFQHDDLAQVGSYDLVVFDEASQVGKAHVMTLARLGKRVLFAGDPKQLSPIVQAQSEAVSVWLGQSAFDWAPRSSLKQATCMLDEQWRMAPNICEIISESFYESKLRVARPALNDPEWLKARTPKRSELLNGDNVVLLEVLARARPAHQFIGYVCPESAEIIAALTVDLRSNSPGQELLILTPYRAQRREIQKQLQSLNASVSLVSTVHRAQGSERSVIIFDPVCPSSRFVADTEGMRLTNVALSRAECRLIVLMQPDWIENSILKNLAAKFPIVPLDASKLRRLLATKLPRVEKSPPVKAVISANPIAKEQTLAEKFEEELLAGLLIRPNAPEHQKQFVRDLAARTSYRGLGYREIEAAMARVSEKLPRLPQIRRNGRGWFDD